MTRKQIKWIRNTIIILIALFVALIASTYILAQVYKKEILAKVNSSINEKISGQVTIGDIHFTIFKNFPGLSLTIDNAVVHDSMYHLHQQKLFSAEKVYLRLEILELLRKEIKFRSITIENASISMIKMKDGYRNYDIVRPNAQEKQTGTESSITATVDKVNFKNLRFTLIDSTMNKWFSFVFIDVEESLETTGDLIQTVLEGSIHFAGLTFNAERGGFLTDKDARVKLYLGFNSSEKKLKIFPSIVRIDQNDIYLQGNFAFSDTSTMHLQIDVPEITNDQANTILTQHIASKLAPFRLENSMMTVIYINGKLYRGSKPAVDVFFKTTNNSLILKSKSLTEVNMLGWFLNHVDSARINDDQNSKVYIPHFSGDLEGIPLRAKLTVDDLADPQLTMDASVNMSLEDAGNLVDSTLMHFAGGKLAVAFSYRGKLVDYVDTLNNQLLGSVEGRLRVQNGEAYYLPRGLAFERVNTDVVFNDSILQINYVQLDLNKNPIGLSGKVYRFIQYIFIPGDHLKAELQVNADTLNLDHFRSPAGIQKKTDKKMPSSESTRKKNFSKIITTILDNIEADILLDAERVTLKRFNATNAGGHVILTDDYLQCREVTMETSGGTFTLNGGVTNLTGSPYQMSIAADISNADISNLFYSFNNFNQKTLTNQNLKGRLTTHATFSTQMKKDYSFLQETMSGKIIVQLKNGALVNFKPLDEVTKFAFKNRGLDHIEFEKLIDTLTIKGQDIYLSRMEIESSAFTLFVEGTYSFVPGRTDMSIQIPLSNLKKRGEDYKPANVGTDKKMGPSVFLRATDTPEGTLQIKYDMFKNYYKDKEVAADSSNTKKEKKQKKND